MDQDSTWPWCGGEWDWMIDGKWGDSQACVRVQHSLYVFLRVSDRWDGGQGQCPLTLRSEAGIAPEQPEIKCSNHM